MTFVLLNNFEINPNKHQIEMKNDSVTVTFAGSLDGVAKMYIEHHVTD